MEFESIRALPLGEAVESVVVEGGATIVGFGLAGALGRQVQNKFGTPDASISDTAGKLKAGLSNNLPKLGLWYVLKKKPLLGDKTNLVRLGVVTNAAFDVGMRLLNDGKNPATATIAGYEVLGGEGSIAGMAGVDANTVQQLVQEIGALKAEVNRLRGGGIQVQQTPMDPRLPPYVGSAVATPAERERRFGFAGTPGAPMTPGAAIREKRYGFAGETNTMSAQGRPGAAYVQVGKMFGMH